MSRSGPGRRDAAPAASGQTLPWPGREAPLGASYDGAGTNFALWSRSAQAVELCLYPDPGDPRAERRVTLAERTHGVWHGYLPGVGPGTRYGYRVHGPWDPGQGDRANAAKLLLDPYARAVEGELADDDAVYGHRVGRDDTVSDARDSAPYVPRSVVVHDTFDWGDDHPPGVPWSDTVLYELHVRGFTRRHPKVPERLRGTYAGLAHPAVLEHLLDLGVTTVELLPVHHFVSEPRLTRRGLSNYWGYNTLAYFAPHAAYSSSGGGGGAVREFKAMVKAFHGAGLEVVLDVVYNHTAELDEHGPTLSLRGIENRAYYRLRHGRSYADFTGCGNSVDLRHPQALQLVTDSLRYWVSEMHVDGFRFDLATTLARAGDGYDPQAPFFTVVGQDPVLSRVKLIAEPWDVGPDGYQLGRFPSLWTEWNDKYRDTVRDFWRGHEGGVRALAYRLSGSSDLYRDDGRRPYASVNFVTAHDGFTLRDLVSYERKRNRVNGDGGRDGNDDNRSWNCGVEGDTDHESVRALRRRQQRNLLATLLLSTGVPMLMAGDEMGRTQRGNNNAYCLDDQTSWVDWAEAARHEDLRGFVRRLVRLRREHPVFRQFHFFDGRPVRAGGRKDVAWFGPHGAELDDAAWFDARLHTLGMLLAGDGLRARTVTGEAVVDESFLVVLHAGASPVAFTLPGRAWARGYETVLDTGCADARARHDAGAVLAVAARTVLVLRLLD